MKYVFLIQLLIITIITMFTSANVLKNKTYLKNTISKSDKFNYFALLFMNITTCYIVAYFFYSSDILKIFLINLSLVAIINVSYSYYVGKKIKKQYIDILTGNIFFSNMLLLLVFLVSFLVLFYEINMLILYVIPFIIGLIIFYIEYKKLRSKGAPDYYKEGTKYHAKGEYNKAFKYFKKAATFDYPAALDSIGLYYEEGKSVLKDEKKAVYYYNKAAKYNYAPSLYNLGFCYFNGKGIEKNYEEAFKCYKKAYELKDLLASYSLGKCYELGNGTAVNYEEAFNCYKFGAANNYPSAYYSLGEFYEKGLFVESSLDEALKNYTSAYNLGLSIAKEKIEYIKEEKIKRKLENIIGLDTVKHEIIGLQAFAKLQKKRIEQNIDSSEKLTLHMIFKGNPGTGKTTIARMVAEMFNNIGVLKTNKVVEVDREALVAQYVGHTAVKTKEVIESALDGVLFIDEAYTLARGGENDFGREAIDTMVKMMEDYRDRIVIILAGYSKDMDNFLKTNSGLKSRFSNIIDFPDYTTDELIKIAELEVKKNGYVLREDAKSKLRQLLEDDRYEPDFGNGRGIRNLFERSVKNMAVRLSKTSETLLTKSDYQTIIPEDIEWVD